MVDVVVVIVSYNTKELTSSCINSVIEKTKGVSYKIYVVDNNSVDGTVELLNKKYKFVKIIKNTENIGFSAANNQVIKIANSKYVFLLNPDTILLNNAVKIFFDFMEGVDNKKVACCGGNLFCQKMQPQLPYGFFPSFKQIIFEQFFLYKLLPTVYSKIPKLGQKDTVSLIKEVPYVSGADLFVRKEVFDTIGGLDERFFLYYEDTDFGLRVKNAGMKSVIVPEAKIIHLIGQSCEPSLAKIKIEKTSEFLFFRKHYGELKTLSLKLIYTMGSLLRLILRGDLKQMKFIKIVWNS